MGTTTKRASPSITRYKLAPSQHIVGNGNGGPVGRIYGEGNLRLAEERVNVAEQELEDMETRLSNLERMVQSLLTHWGIAPGQPIPLIPPPLQ